jgi:hypothetical protein
VLTIKESKGLRLSAVQEWIIRIVKDRWNNEQKSQFMIGIDFEHPIGWYEEYEFIEGKKKTTKMWKENK